MPRGERNPRPRKKGLWIQIEINCDRMLDRRGQSIASKHLLNCMIAGDSGTEPRQPGCKPGSRSPISTSTRREIRNVKKHYTHTLLLVRAGACVRHVNGSGPENRAWVSQ